MTEPPTARQLGPDVEDSHTLPPNAWADVVAGVAELGSGIPPDVMTLAQVRMWTSPAAADIPALPAPIEQSPVHTMLAPAPKIPNPVTAFIAALNHGGAMGHPPTLLVVHDAETPLKAGYARSLAANWFAKEQPAGRESSAHYIVDPADVVQMVHTYDIAWHVGPKANGFTLGYEQSGWASLTGPGWTTTDGQKQMSRLAAIMATDALFYGIPAKWATDDDIRAAAKGVKGGICRHSDITRVLGGTTHTDPGPGYPRDALLSHIRGLLAPPVVHPDPVTAANISGRVPMLRLGMRDPIAFGGGMYVHRVQQLLSVKPTGVYDEATRAAVAAMNARLLNRRTDGKTVDAMFWHRLYGLA